eukprot:539586-Prorocentrum_minimum.AAC.1
MNCAPREDFGGPHTPSHGHADPNLKNAVELCKAMGILPDGRVVCARPTVLVLHKSVVVRARWSCARPKGAVELCPTVLDPSVADPPPFGAAADGDADRNMILNAPPPALNPPPPALNPPPPAHNSGPLGGGPPTLWGGSGRRRGPQHDSGEQVLLHPERQPRHHRVLRAACHPLFQGATTPCPPSCVYTLFDLNMTDARPEVFEPSTCLPRAFAFRQ